MSEYLFRLGDGSVSAKMHDGSVKRYIDLQHAKEEHPYRELITLEQHQAREGFAQWQRLNDGSTVYEPLLELAGHLRAGRAEDAAAFIDRWQRDVLGRDDHSWKKGPFEVVKLRKAWHSGEGLAFLPGDRTLSKRVEVREMGRRGAPAPPMRVELRLFSLRLGGSVMVPPRLVQPVGLLAR